MHSPAPAHTPTAPRAAEPEDRRAPGTSTCVQGLAEELEVTTGEFLYIPAGLPHLPYNASDAEACTALLARTDPNEQESVVLLDGAGRRP